MGDHASVNPFDQLCESTHPGLVAATCPWCGRAIVGGTPIDEWDEPELDDQQNAIVLYVYERGGRFTEEQLYGELIASHIAEGITRAKLSTTLARLVQYGVLYRTSGTTQTVYTTIR